MGILVVQTDEEWGIPHLLNNIRRALQSGRQTIITKILKFLLGSCPEYKATKRELLNECEIQCFTHYTQWNKEHSRYLLLVESNNYWSINLVVLQALRQNNLLHYFE